ncbi:nuclear transport factor 2 family protein [Spartinivicinus poritis]|uniref:Nuclear transport factor 2 family protein n=1 Tax=Spartinivicinus poritis TaxID=2994640 RepID=A0ABT5UGL5_9GAMM|nr:nuclear transport factor 2 family protein [Spartinivicinus sp. A2-2]MDE1464578.1 nuclear transport factor 2 family protein [Spartinivicinus sp. A2-2]
MPAVNYEEILTTFKARYLSLNSHNLNQLSIMYTDNVVFIDPVNKFTNVASLQNYFEALYQNLTSCTFKFEEETYINPQGVATIPWQLTYSHLKLNGNQPIQLNGISLVKFLENGKAFYHQDYFDLGSMLYEHIPVLGYLVKKLKHNI